MGLLVNRCVWGLRFITCWTFSIIDVLGLRLTCFWGLGPLFFRVKVIKSFKILDFWALLSIDFKGSRFIILLGLKLDRCLRCATATHTFERFWVHRFCASKFIDFPVKSTHQVFRQRLVYPPTLANSSPAPQEIFSSNACCHLCGRTWGKKTAKFEYRSMAQFCTSIWARKNQTKIEITGKRRIYAKILSFQFRKLGHQKRKVWKNKNGHKAPDQDGTML